MLGCPPSPTLLLINPPFNHRFLNPKRQAASLFQRSVILTPVADSQGGFWFCLHRQQGTEASKSLKFYLSHNLYATTPIINSPPVISVIERVNGCEQVFAKYPSIKVLSKDQNAEGSRDGGLRVMSDLLATFPKLDAAFAINDPTGVGAELAAKQAKRSEFFIVGVDGAPEAKDAIKDKRVVSQIIVE